MSVSAVLKEFIKSEKGKHAQRIVFEQLVASFHTTLRRYENPTSQTIRELQYGPYCEKTIKRLLHELTPTEFELACQALEHHGYVSRQTTSRNDLIKMKKLGWERWEQAKQEVANNG